MWDREALTFDREADHGLADPECRAAWRDLLADALPDPPARVADLGCGTGTLSLLLAEEGHTVTGVDFSPAMVERARAKAGHLAEFHVGDAAEPPLEPAVHDVVLSRHVLWALPDPAAALTRWIGLLAPGGRLVLVEGRWHTGGGLTVPARRSTWCGPRAARPGCGRCRSRCSGAPRSTTSATWWSATVDM